MPIRRHWKSGCLEAEAHRHQKFARWTVSIWQLDSLLIGCKSNDASLIVLSQSINQRTFIQRHMSQQGCSLGLGRLGLGAFLNVSVSSRYRNSNVSVSTLRLGLVSVLASYVAFTQNFKVQNYYNRQVSRDRPLLRPPKYLCREQAEIFFICF